MPLSRRAFDRGHKPAAMQMTIGGDDHDPNSQTGGQMPARLQACYQHYRGRRGINHRLRNGREITLRDRSLAGLAETACSDVA
jgi:hypothetical protein